MPLKTITITRGSRDGASVLEFRTELDSFIAESMDELGAAWSKEDEVWYVPNSEGVLQPFFQAFRNYAWLDISALRRKETARPRNLLAKRELPEKNLSPEVRAEIALFIELLGARGYAANTRATYRNMIEVLFGYFSDKKPDEVSNDDLNHFLHEWHVIRGYSSSYMRQMVGAVKLFFSGRLDRKLDLDKLELPRSRRRLPKVLSMEEINLILDNIVNLKHRALISLQYGCGLRISEVLAIEPTHIDGDRMTLMVINSKGRLDRRIHLSESLLQLLRSYYRTYIGKNRSQKYLFEGAGGGKYSASSVNKILKQAAARAGIRRSVSSHMLRHSYATHLLEHGVDLRYIQELLGHKSSKTTEIYTYVSKKHLAGLPSPFDFLKRNDRG